MAKAPTKKTKKYLTAAQKEELQRLWRTNRFTRQELAEKFDISHSSVCKLVAAAPILGMEPMTAGLLKIGELIATAKAEADKIGFKLVYILKQKD